MKRFFVLLLFCAVTLSAHAQYGITLRGALFDPRIGPTNSQAVAVDAYGGLKTSPDGSVWYQLTPTLTNSSYASNAVMGRVYTLTNIVTGERCPQIISLQIIQRDNIAMDFSAVFFRSSPTNGTYTDGTAVSYGNDITNIVPIISSAVLGTNGAYGFSWGSSGGASMLCAEPIYYDYPVLGTNGYLVLLSKSTQNLTNFTVLIGIRK